MLFNIFSKKKRKDSYKKENLYAFNLEEIEQYNKLNKLKESNNKKDSISSLKILKEDFKPFEEDNIEQTLPKEELERKEVDISRNDIIVKEQSNIKQEDDLNTECSETINAEIGIEKDNVVEFSVDEVDKEIEQTSINNEIKPKFSYVKLSKENQEIITKSMQNVDLTKLEKVIEKGEDLINHNYTISYCDDAYKFINEIREEYDVVIKYLIGFNNEKNGIFDKTKFGENDIDEWRYLSNYIKLLEKIKKLKSNF